MNSLAVIHENGGIRLCLDDGKASLFYRGETYTFGCHPYEPMAIICKDDATFFRICNAEVVNISICNAKKQRYAAAVVRQPYSPAVGLYGCHKVVELVALEVNRRVEAPWQPQD